ncbi:hypothetical protein GWK47_048877 [Chionoecetes opilio]|uniref:Uncharacterized protein n=1 Tax=Chionoecetes opilio TaxID=41210 RepID=A0A8J4Y2M0_CHIOP|nr:hypothetical protein GWK47_048877 [Chionoecetes opilio]
MHYTGMEADQVPNACGQGHGTSGGDTDRDGWPEVLLSIVGMEGRSTAENEAAKIIQTWIENSTKETLRHDYLELAELTLLFLGGTVPCRSEIHHHQSAWGIPSRPLD